MKEQDAAHSSLSPCPFCGLFPEWINETIPDGHFYIRCPHCHIVMKEDRRDKVIGMWNRREEIQQLKAWKESELKLWSPILEYMRTHPDRRLGESIPDRVLEFLKEHSRLKSELQQKDEIIKELIVVAARISTERQRIEKEAEGISRLRVWPEHIRVNFKNGFIAGATSEHDKARNQAIQDCIEVITLNNFSLLSEMVKALEQLKKRV